MKFRPLLLFAVMLLALCQAGREVMRDLHVGPRSVLS